MVVKKCTLKPKRLDNCIPDYELARDGVTQSMLSSFVNCRKVMEHRLQGWKSDKPRDALVFGSMLHWFIENTYNTKKVDIKKNLIKGIKMWTKQSRKEGLTEEVIQKHNVWIKALYPAYVEYWKKSDKKKTWVELEVVFDVQFQNKKSDNVYRLRGRRDGIYKLKNKEQYLMENKSASQINEATLSSKLVFDFQNLFYITSVLIERGIELAGVCYNVVRKPQTKQYKNETLKQYELRLIEDIAKRPDFYFVRQEVPYSKKVQKEFREQLQNKLDDFNGWLNKEIPSYRNESACTAKWSCDYLSMCASHGGKGGYIQSSEMFTELGD